jgi:hypothetical protein
MKKAIQRRSDDELYNYPITNIIEGWFFQIHEISQSYYRVEGVDRWGHSVSRDGIDPEALLNALKNDIIEMSSDF